MDQYSQKEKQAFLTSYEKGRRRIFGDYYNHSNHNVMHLGGKKTSGEHFGTHFLMEGGRSSGYDDVVMHNHLMLDQDKNPHHYNPLTVNKNKSKAALSHTRIHQDTPNIPLLYGMNDGDVGDEVVDIEEQQNNIHQIVLNLRDMLQSSNEIQQNEKLTIEAKIGSMLHELNIHQEGTGAGDGAGTAKGQHQAKAKASHTNPWTHKLNTKAGSRSAAGGGPSQRKSNSKSKSKRPPSPPGHSKSWQQNSHSSPTAANTSSKAPLRHHPSPPRGRHIPPPPAAAGLHHRG